MFYFKSNVVHPPATIYVGRDKFENDEMLKFADPNDVWFHVNDMSSAHVYLQMRPEWTIGTIPGELLADCGQLVKANSIEGNKINGVRVTYTPVSNLRKENGFDPGQVTFHSTKACRTLPVHSRVNEIVNRLNKTREERVVDFARERVARQKEETARRRAEEERAKASALKEAEKKRAEEELLCYGSVMKGSSMTSNKHDGPVDVNAYEEDFF